MAADPYVYAGTNVLKNHFGERDQSKLSVIEADVVWPRFTALYSHGVDAAIPLSPDLHKAVHQGLFERVYPFAGEFRTINIAKDGEILYATVAFLDSNAEKTWLDIRTRFETPRESVEDVVSRLVTSMGDLHVLHPFREGKRVRFSSWSGISPGGPATRCGGSVRIQKRYAALERLPPSETTNRTRSFCSASRVLYKARRRGSRLPVRERAELQPKGSERENVTFQRLTKSFIIPTRFAPLPFVEDDVLLGIPS